MGRHRHTVKWGVAALAAATIAAVVADGGDPNDVLPMSEERLASEVLGNPAAASCTAEGLDEARIPLDVLKSIVPDRSGSTDDRAVLGPSELATLDEAQAIMWRCMARPADPVEQAAAPGGSPAGAAVTSVGSSAEVEVATGPPADVVPVRVEGQPPVYNHAPVWAPAPGTVTVASDGAAVIAEQPVTVIVPFEQLPERATNRT